MNKKIMDGLELVQELNKNRLPWSPPSNNYLMADDEKILAHWLTYITDQQQKLETKAGPRIWGPWHKILSFWVKEYKKGANIENYFKDNTFIGDGKKFKSRFPSKHFRAIKRTLELLEDYNKSLVNFILQVLKKHENDTDVIKKIACYLFLLTYEGEKNENNTKNNINETKKIFNDISKFQNFYKKWNPYHKRLWAAFRDYIKPNFQEIFINALRENRADEKYILCWKHFGQDFVYLNQLELPGDVWNSNPKVALKLFAPLAIELGIEFTIKDTSKVVREICNKVNENSDIKIYPEQFDITFDEKLRKILLEKLEKIKNLGD